MMISEFIERTGFEPMADEYAKIEEAYCGFDGDKDAFCRAFVQANGEKRVYQARAAKIEQLRRLMAEQEKRAKDTADHYKKENASLREQLDKELEWKPYEMPQNVQQAEYETLAKNVFANGCAHYMTDEEALDWICKEFGFDRSWVTILHEIDEQEINRHNLCRASGRKIDRRPVYFAMDYHYIRFNVGLQGWRWEAWNGRIRPFYD